MKVTPEHLAVIREAIEATGYATDEGIRERYRRRDIPRGDAVQDIDKRFRWDLFHAADSQCAILRTLYDAGYNDAHLDTALRAIVAPLGSSETPTPSAPSA